MGQIGPALRAALTGGLPAPDIAPVMDWLGRAETLLWGTDGAIIACGTVLPACLKAAEELRKEGIDVTVINAPQPSPTVIITGSAPGATVSDSRNPKASKRWILW